MAKVARQRLHVILPEDLLRSLEVRREREDKHRSEVLEEAVRLWLVSRDADELERRLGLSTRLKDLEELVLSLRDRTQDLQMKNLYAVERVFALIEGQFGERLAMDRSGANRVAHERIGRMRWRGGGEEEQ